MADRKLTALLREKVVITGDGNVIGKDNTVNVVKQTAGLYAIQIGQVNITLTLDELRRVVRCAVASSPFLVPFPRNPDFVGRETDLVALHELLSGAKTVGIRPTGLSGMGGIGKTQLAIEYAYRYRDDYPGGIFWLNALDNWAEEFARVARHLALATMEDGLDTQIRAAWNYLNAHPDALVILDNVPDPALLNLPFLPGLVPAGLGCRLLFTTRQRYFKSQFSSYELKVLPKDAAMSLLLRHPTRQEILDKEHPEHGWARVICTILGYLPLALELAAAFLGQYPEISLYDYRLRLLREGAMDTLDDTDLRPEDMPTRHEAAVQATLQASWEALTDEHARLVLRAAGQLREAELIPVVRLGLLTGLATKARPGHPAPLKRALKKLAAASLIEELTGETVRLHPLVREYAGRQTPKGDAGDAFRAQLASNILDKLGEVAILEAHTAQRGIDAVLGDLRTGLKLCPVKAPGYAPLQMLERIMDREAHYIRSWDPALQPLYFMQRVHARAVRLQATAVQHESEKKLDAYRRPHLRLRWRSGAEDFTLLRTLVGHTGAVQSVAVTSDGRRAVSASLDSTLQVWDLETGVALHTLKGHTKAVEAVAVTPDDSRIVSASRDKTLKVWDLETGQEILTLEGHTGQVKAVAVTPDATRVVSASEDKTVRVWDLETGQQIHMLEGHTGMVWTLAVTPDGTRAISGSSDNTIKVWDLKGGQEIRTLEGHRNLVTAVAVTPDGTRLVSGSSDRTVKVWDLETGHTLYSLDEHTPVSAVVVMPDGTRAISAFNDPTLKVWDLETGQEVRTLKGHANAVFALAVPPNGTLLVSASADGTLKVWDLETEQLFHGFEGHGWIVFSVAVVPDGTRAVSASHDNTVRVWDMDTGELLHNLGEHSAPVRAVVVTPDSTRAVSASRDKTLKVWDLETGREIRTLEGHTDTVSAVAVTADGTRAVSASEDRTLKVWNLETGEEIRTLEGLVDSINEMALMPDGIKVILASNDGTLRVWNLETGEEVLTLKGHTGSVKTVAITPDGQRAVSGSSDKTLRVWDLDTGQMAQMIEGHTSDVEAVAVTPDGKRAISASRDRTVKVWDLRTGCEIASFDGDGVFLCIAAIQRATGLRVIAGDLGGAVWAFELVE